MTNLRVVDLRGNALRALPDDIGCLVRLETLDVGENALETLPKSLRELSSGFVDSTSRRTRAQRSTACLDALGNCIDLESVDASKNRSMCGALPVSWGCLIKLKEINVDETSRRRQPSEIFLRRASRCRRLRRETVRGTRRGGDERDGRTNTTRRDARGSTISSYRRAC